MSQLMPKLRDLNKMAIFDRENWDITNMFFYVDIYNNYKACFTGKSYLGFFQSVTVLSIMLDYNGLHCSYMLVWLLPLTCILFSVVLLYKMAGLKIFNIFFYCLSSVIEFCPISLNEISLQSINMITLFRICCKCW